MSSQQGQKTNKTNKAFWDDGGGFFGRGYMEGDNSFEGFLSTTRSLDERTKLEVDGVVRLLGLQPGQSLLDCPCGYGRHSIALARTGIEVVGSDINSEMLAPALEHSKGLSNIRFVRENMTEIDYHNEFDAVINLFFSFGFFETDEENNEVLRHFYDALKPGGKFLMHTDVNVPRLLSKNYKFHELRNLRNGKKLEIVESYDPLRQRLRGQWILIDPDGAREELSPYKHIVYTYDRFAEICREVGFDRIEGYGDWMGAPLLNDSEEMMIVAWKPL